MDTLRPTSFVGILLLVSFLACFFELGRMDVVWANEGQRAAPPAEMLRGHDWVMPTLNGRPYLAKPPLLYWVIGGLYSVTGSVSEWIARVPTALCMVSLVLTLYGFGRRLVGELAARWASLAVLAAPYFLERARWANLDLPLTFATFLCLMLLYVSWESAGATRRYGMAVLSGLALAAATLLKGPVPYLFLAAALLARLLLEAPPGSPLRRRALAWSFMCFGVAVVFIFVRVSFPVALVLLLGGWVYLGVVAGGVERWRLILPAGVTLVVGASLPVPWALAVLNRMGWDNVSTLLNSEVVDRTHTATAINSGTPFYFFLGLVAMLAPLSLLLPLQFSSSSWREADRHYRWCVTAGWLSVLIFSLIAGKEYEYILPGVPLLLLALGVNLARATEGAYEDWRGVYFKGWGMVMRAVFTVCAVGLPVYAVLLHPEPVLVFEMCGAAVVAISVLWWPVRRAALPVAGRIAVASTFLIVGGLVLRSFENTGEKSPKTIGRLCGDLVEAGYPVEATRIYPQFTYYAEHHIPEVLDTEAIIEQLKGDKPYFYLTREQFVQAFHGEAVPGTVVVMGPVSDKELMLVTNEAGEAALAGLLTRS